MEKSYRKGLFIVLAVLLAGTLVLPTAIATDGDAASREKMGIDPGSGSTPAKLKGPATLNRAGGVLLIPESLSDTVGMYDPYDGTYLGDLIDNSLGLFSTPINAVLGPDGNIYVSDQFNDSVNVFDTSGNWLLTYADASDGLNNIRGIDFRGDHLFVTSGDDYVAEFDGPHSRLPDFIGSGMDPFDVHFLSDGSALVCDILGDQMQHYDAGGILIANLFTVDFLEQVQFDSDLPGAFLSNSFSADQITDFELDGTIVNTWFFNSGRGIYRLGNGNLLATSGDGVWEIDPATGNLLQQENTGSARFIEYLPSTDSLTIDNDTIVETVGGKSTFSLDAGAANANRNYLILGGVTGSSPGTPLPGGMATLPVNWDVFTGIVIDLLNTAIFQNFLGSLNANGQASALFDTLGPVPGAAGVTMTFAFALNNPWDFASNAVEIKIIP